MCYLALAHATQIKGTSFDLDSYYDLLVTFITTMAWVQGDQLPMILHAKNALHVCTHVTQTCSTFSHSYSRKGFMGFGAIEENGSFKLTSY